MYRRQSGTQKKLKIEEIRLSSKVKFKESTDFNTLNWLFKEILVYRPNQDTTNDTFWII